MIQWNTVLGSNPCQDEYFQILWDVKCRAKSANFFILYELGLFIWYNHLFALNVRLLWNGLIFHVLSAQETHLVSGGNDCSMFVWDLAPGGAGYEFSHSRKICALAGHTMSTVYMADSSANIQASCLVFSNNANGSNAMLPFLQILAQNSTILFKFNFLNFIRVLCFNSKHNYSQKTLW